MQFNKPPHRNAAALLCAIDKMQNIIYNNRVTYF